MIPTSFPLANVLGFSRADAEEACNPAARQASRYAVSFEHGSMVVTLSDGRACNWRVAVQDDGLATKINEIRDRDVPAADIVVLTLEPGVKTIFWYEV